MASVYGRGAGSLEKLMRLLAERTGLAPRFSVITPAKLKDAGEEARQLARVSCELAASLLDAAERLSTKLEGFPNSQH